MSTNHHQEMHARYTITILATLPFTIQHIVFAEFLGVFKIFNCQQIWRILNWLKLSCFLFRLAWTKMMRLSIICLAKTKTISISVFTTVCLNWHFYVFGSYFSPWPKITGIFPEKRASGSHISGVAGIFLVWECIFIKSCML